MSDVEMQEVVTEIATNMLAKIPSPWNPEQLKGGKGKQTKTAMYALMLQEVERMQEIVSIITLSFLIYLSSLITLVKDFTPH